MVPADLGPLAIYLTAPIRQKILAGSLEFNIPVVFMINVNPDILMIEIPEDLFPIALAFGLIYLYGNITATGTTLTAFHLCPEPHFVYIFIVDYRRQSNLKKMREAGLSRLLFDGSNLRTH
jgi:hypothetical protein